MMETEPGRFRIWEWESIRRHEGELYLRRLRVVSCRWFGVYVHWFHASDDDSLHDHPWWFLTFILWGGYWEHTPGADGAPARWLHRLEIDPARRPVTVVVRGRRIRQWGFQTRSGWIPWPDHKEQRPEGG